ncbi:hypothetical protein HMPREF9374_1146 [Desmospora sp. 8437]|nr:hypothetical protein HMPREF9374_1146 [Desmospora sp. 8437]
MAVDRSIMQMPVGGNRQIKDLFLEKPVERITTSMDLDCALAQYKEHKQIIEEYTQQRDERIAQINMWLASVTKEHLQEMERIEGLLREHHERWLQENPKAKTIKRPFGQLKARKSPDKWNYREDDLLRWAKENRPDLVRVKEEPNKQQLKQKTQVKDGWVYTEDGERVEGVMVTPGEIQYKVEVE